MPPQHAFRSDLLVLYARGALRHLRRADGIGIWVGASLSGASDKAPGYRAKRGRGAEERPRFWVLS